MENIVLTTGQRVEQLELEVQQLKELVATLAKPKTVKQMSEVTRENIISKRTIKDRKHATGFRGVNKYSYRPSMDADEVTVYQVRVRGYVGSFGTFEDAKEATIRRCLELRIL